MAETFSFVQTTQDGSGKPYFTARSTKTIRSHAMKDVRRRQREALVERLQKRGTRDRASCSLSTSETSTSSPQQDAPSLDSELRICEQDESDTRHSQPRKSRRRQSSKRPNGSSRLAITELPTVASTKSSSNVQCLPSLPYEVHSHNVYGAGLIANHMYDKFGSFAHLSSDVKTNVLGATLRPRTPLQQTTSLTNTLMWLGSKTGDAHLLLEARRQYVAGSQLFRSQIGELANLASLLSAASKLKACTFYMETPAFLLTRDVWTGYINGVATFLRDKAQDPANIKLPTWQLHAFRHETLIQSLLWRQPVVNEDIWEICSQMSLPEVAERITQLALRLPTLLRRDQAQYGDLDSTSKRLRLLDLETDFLKLQHEFRPLTNEVGYRTETHGSDAPPNPLLAAHCQAFFWTCMLLLRQELLIESQSNPSQTIDAGADRDLFAETDECAAQMCRIVECESSACRVPWSKAFVVRALFHFACEWFEYTQNHPRLLWCWEQEALLRAEMPYIDWTVMLYHSFWTMIWLS